MREKISKLIDLLNKSIIVLLLLFSVFNIIAPFILFQRYSSVSLMHYFEIHHIIKRLLSFIILIVVYKLYKRVSAAWAITMVALSIMIFQHILVHRYKSFNILFLIEIIIFFVLLLSRNYYCRKTDKYSLKRGVLIYLCYVAFVFLNATIGFFNMKRLNVSMLPFPVCINQTVDVMFNMDSQNSMIFTQNMIYHRFVFFFSWSCIVLGLLLVLTPYISKKIQTQDEIDKARKLVKKFGQNSSSYLTLEKGKNYYFGKAVEGYVAYGIIKDTVVVLGEPICSAKDFIILLSEFKNYCEKNAYSIIFLNTTTMFLNEYSKLGLGCVKCGEEPKFYLKDYSIAGGAGSKIRLNINHATKAGIKVLEYEPLKGRDTVLEKEIIAVSQEWFSMKKSSELVFTMGGIDFDNPMDRRYFYAVNTEKIVEGFIVFVPFAGMNGYMTDVTRHGKNATRGVMETIFYEAMMKFKSEGIEWGSLSLAPLARLEEEPEVTAKFLNIIYEKMNNVYGFKSLYQTKLKYNPTYWEPSYYVYYPAVFTPAMAYAIIRIQNPLGIKDYIKAFFKNCRNNNHNQKEEK